MNIMVSDLPEPCVCQMMPLRSRGLFPSSRRLTASFGTADSAHDLDCFALIVRENSVKVRMSQAGCAVQHPGDQALIIRAHFRVQIIQSSGIWVSPAVEVFLYGL
jgi:hypothetical protein